jgi:glycosyltransferase involved in cell wall biosynthesis/predicted metal-dependent phosphoesterase TrpH
LAPIAPRLRAAFTGSTLTRDTLDAVVALGGVGAMRKRTGVRAQDGASDLANQEAMLETMARCDLHVHSVASTDSGNFALRKARLGESYTSPERVYEACLRRGMSLVTISDHNSLEGALRIADRPGVFLSEEVTTCFAEDGLPLHVLVWNLTEEDHCDLQPWRPSVVDLVGFLRERDLVHALAHPLYRMGAPLTPAHVERLMLLFGVWEGRNGARPRESNELACRIAAAATPEYLAKLAERHGIVPEHERIGLTGGSDDHGALDIATTWTEAPGSTATEFLQAVRTGRVAACGEHGSATKLAHAVGALLLNAYRRQDGRLPEPFGTRLEQLFDEDADDATSRHAEIEAAVSHASRGLADRARSGALAIESLPTLGSRLGTLLLAGGLEAPYLASLRHQAGGRPELAALEASFFPVRPVPPEPRALVFTDTFEETNGVAGTMRRLAHAAGAGELPVRVVLASRGDLGLDGAIGFPPDWSVPIPGQEAIELRFPTLTEVLARVERERPNLIHVATPGPVGLCGLAAAKLLGLPLVGSYHTELAPYALHLTRDLLVSEAIGLYVDWFYGRCDRVLAPTRGVAEQLAARGFAPERLVLWGRGVDPDAFSPERRREHLRQRLLDGGDLLLLSVGRLSQEKRLDVLLAAFAELRRQLPGVRLAIVGDGPAREALEQGAPAGVRFLGELHGVELAELYASADVFCFPSTTDTFGQVLLEAGASGLPVVAARAGGGAELVADGATGLLVRPDDANALAAALRLLADDAELRAQLGRSGRLLALARGWPDSFAQLLAVYRGALGVPSARREPALALG